MITKGALRSIIPQISRRCYATAVSHGHGHGHESAVGEHKVHPLFNEHPHAPVVTYDYWPVPVLSYKEGYEKPNKTYNVMLAASVAAFTATLLFMWKDDTIGYRMTGPPKWYTHRKIGKGLGDI